MKLRHTWQRCYQAALQLLEKANHPIADYTLKVIKKKRLLIIPFQQMLKKDFKIFLSDFNDEKKKKLSADFPPNKEVVNEFTKIWSAKIVGNRVSINTGISDPKQIAEILVHEANHFLNDSIDHYTTKEQKFLEEFRAEVAEALVFSRPVRNGKLREIANHVADRFNMPHPKKVEMPSGLFVSKKR